METICSTSTLCTPLEVAGKYLQLMRAYLLPEVMAQVLAGTAEPGLDTNMLMAAAFEELHDREPWLPSDVEDELCTEAQHDADLNLMNAAAALVQQQCQDATRRDDGLVERAITLVSKLYGNRQRPTVQDYRQGKACDAFPLPHMAGNPAWSWEALIHSNLPLVADAR